MSDEVNGLKTTSTRVRILKLIRDEPGRIYYEANHVYDRTLGVKVTNRVLEMIGHKWITAEKVTPQTKRPGEYPNVVYYRVAEAGQQVLDGEQQ